jgi:TPR repeat protein
MIYSKNDINEKDIKKNLSTKYLKYKKKYLQLKNQLGGDPFCEKVYNNRLGTCWAVAIQTLLTFGQATSDALREKITTINSDRKLLTERIHQMYASHIFPRIFPPNFFTKENYKLIYDLLDTFIDRYMSKIFGQRVVADTFNTGFCEYKIAETFNKILPIQSFFSLDEYSGNNTFDYVFGNLLSVSLLDQRISLINYYDRFNEIKFDPSNDLGILINLRDHVCCLYICNGTQKYYDNNERVYDCNWSDILSKSSELYVNLSNNFEIVDYQTYPNKEKLKKVESLTLIKKNSGVSDLDIDILNLLKKNYSEVKDKTLQFEIGYHFYEGAGNDKQRGIKFFESSASQGYTRAQVILGFIFWNGENVSEDKEKGMRLLELAASQGNAEALTYMFKIYEEQENYEEALQYLLRAAECGKVDMQFLLGILHIRQFRNEDKEVEVRNKNRDEAIRWLDAAANNDHHEAQFNLGLLQMQGNPDEQSSGIKWMKIAASNQYQDAIEWIAANQSP